MSDATAGFVDVRDEAGKLRLRYDPARDLVEIVDHGRRVLIDLRDYKPGGRLAQEPERTGLYCGSVLE